MNRGEKRRAPTPAVVGIARSMRARDVSRPRTDEQDHDEASATAEPAEESEGSGGSTPVDS